MSREGVEEARLGSVSREGVEGRSRGKESRKRENENVIKRKSVEE